MKFTKTQIPDVVLIEPKIFSDQRGFFFESYNKTLFVAAGIPDEFVQDNHSRSAKGTLRGLHYQIEPMAQGKLVRVIRGAAFDVAVDLRKGSPTFGRWVGEQLSADTQKMLYVPIGFAHGFLSLEDGTEVLYKVTRPYSPAHDRGIIWNDPAIGIQWPDLGMEYLVSDKDRQHPALGQTPVFA